MRDTASIFVSGHSLLARPIPTELEQVSRSLGQSAPWNMQYMVGSTIRARTRGDTPHAWTGYRRGENRDGTDMNVIAELREPRTIGARLYDTLLITEQHGVLGSLVWNDTVRYLRHFHDRFIEGNPAGTTYFYAPVARRGRQKLTRSAGSPTSGPPRRCGNASPRGSTCR